MALPAPSGFPATVTHQYGTTTVQRAPQRVVSVGYNDQDAILACGVVPVGMLRWFTNQELGVGPWAAPYLKGQRPEIIPPTELNFENLVKLQPDLITGIYRDMKPEEYQRLSQIAPTVSQPSSFIPFGVPWREEARLIATALGQQAAMERIIADIEGRFTAATRANPKFAGKTCAVAVSGTDYYVYGKQDPRSRFMEALGLTISPRIDDGSRKEFSYILSPEQIQLLDVDLLVMFAGNTAAQDKLKNDTLYQGLNVVKQGRVVLIQDLGAIQAFSMNSVLSLPYSLDLMVPLIAAAIK